MFSLHCTAPLSTFHKSLPCSARSKYTLDVQTSPHQPSLPPSVSSHPLWRLISTITHEYNKCYQCIYSTYLMSSPPWSRTWPRWTRAPPRGRSLPCRTGSCGPAGTPGSCTAVVRLSTLELSQTFAAFHSALGLLLVENTNLTSAFSIKNLWRYANWKWAFRHVK